MRTYRTRTKEEIEFDAKWGELSVYNTEVARGIVHTPEWKERMRELQRQYDEWSNCKKMSRNG